MSAIAVRGACKSYAAASVLDGLDLYVPAGSITAVLGASGSGKTTLLRSIAGFERLDAGTIAIADTVVDDGRNVMHPQHRDVGYVPQDGALFPHLRVYANIAFGLKGPAGDRVAELVEMLGLQNLERRFPQQLSGGQRQRVALARALAPKPRVLLLDEPFASLDAALRAELRQQVAHVLRDVGATAILVTQDRDEALSMADQIALLRAGRIVAVGSPRDLYTAPADEHVARFLGAANLIPAKVVSGQLICAIPVSKHGLDVREGAYTLLLRPEHLTIATRSEQDGAEAAVAAVSYRGATVDVHLKVDTHELVAQAPGDQQLTVGQRVWVSATGIGASWLESEGRPDQRGAEDSLKTPSRR